MMDENKLIFNIICEDFTTNRKKLFTEALKFASYGKVMYIAFNELVELPENINNFLNKDTMKMISFMYVQSLESLIEGISTLMHWENVPSTIILDDLTSFCDKNNLQNACGVIALLINTISSCSLSLSTQCRLSVSINKEVVDEQFYNMLKELYLHL